MQEFWKNIWPPSWFLGEGEYLVIMSNGGYLVIISFTVYSFTVIRIWWTMDSMVSLYAESVIWRLISLFIVFLSGQVLSACWKEFGWVGSEKSFCWKDWKTCTQYWTIPLNITGAMFITCHIVWTSLLMPPAIASWRVICMLNFSMTDCIFHRNKLI